MNDDELKEWEIPIGETFAQPPAEKVVNDAFLKFEAWLVQKIAAKRRRPSRCWAIPRQHRGG